MKFRMAKEEVSSLKEFFIKTIKGQNEYKMLTALNDINFEVKQGEVVGIIGTNGSGKSTLLKIISGVLKPSSGEAIVDKDRVQMLTLGTGFDMELTARENVYLNGAIIGYTKEYLDEKFEDIVSFAELDGFMDERMKNFSSGMVSRLGFAIATMRDAPDILILDEVLSVGDFFFRKKSEKRIKELIHSGATVLIVSHSMETIRNNCSKVIWIEKGVQKMVGDAKEVCDAYIKNVE
ncbi:ABC transporter ATP-binding protein [Lachnospiraceae bacterium OttesenSCG-928-D06]|nr:ABC transporter ATP-binding protein [Lachnospiraceae bacterium OttesenSCG-928-D06]